MITPFLQAYSQSDMFGKLIFFGLFFISVISWIVLIHKIVLMRKLNRVAKEFEESFFTKKNREAILQTNVEYYLDHPFSIIFSTIKERSLEILNKNKFFLGENVCLSLADIELIRTNVETSIDRQIKFLERHIFVLSTTVTLAPFLGLLGTVWGILVTFSNLQSHSIASGNSAVLSGLALALTTTVGGLVVAIPALIAYNYLRSGIRDITRDMENFSNRLLATIELQYRRVDAK